MGDPYDLELDNPYRAPVADLQPPRSTFDLPGTTHPIDGNPWITIWTQPRGTIRHIVNVNPRQNVLLLGCLGGFFSLTSNVLTQASGTTDLMSSLIGSLLLGPVLGLLVLYINSYMMQFAGRFVGGSADSY